MEINTSTSMGELVISEEVISAIATNAAKDVDGIAGFSNRPVDVVNTIKKGSLKVMSPVRVLADGEDLNISIYVNMLPGKKIRQVAEEVQRAVKESVQNMTGKLVSKVNVIIAGLEFDQPESETTFVKLKSKNGFYRQGGVSCRFFLLEEVYEAERTARAGVYPAV